MKVRIPFLSIFENPMVRGIKTCTSRTRRFGKVRDTFVAFGVEFVILEVMPNPLRVVANNLYRQEGFDMPNDFIICWNKIHPVKKYNPDQEVFVHFFRRLDCAVTQ